MNICFMINTLTNGGAERVVSLLANEMVETGNNVTIMLFSRENNQYTTDPRVTIEYINEPEITGIAPVRLIKRVCRIRNYCKSNNVDVLASFMRTANFYAIYSTVLSRTASVLSVRNDPNYEYKTLMDKLYSKILFNFADGIVFQTKDARDWFGRRVKEKSRIIYNPIGDPFFQVKNSPIKGNIVACGRLEKQKNYPLLINTFKELIVDYPFLRLNIYGEGAERNNITKMITRLGLTEYITLKGRTNNVEEVYRFADIFVLSSEFEGMPNALMEAMAAGVSCVSTDCPCGGPGELIVNGENGIIVRNNDKQALREAIEYLINNQEEKAELGKRAKESMKKMTVSAISKNWINYFLAIERKNKKC